MLMSSMCLEILTVLAESCDQSCLQRCVKFAWWWCWHWIFLSGLWHCWLGDRKGIRPVKSWVLVCWWWRFDWSFTRRYSSCCHHYLSHP